MHNFVTLFAEANDRSYSNCFLCVFKFRKHVLSKKILSFTKYVTLLQRTESAFLSTVFFVFISFKNTYCGQKHCTVCKNSLHCCKGKRQPYYLTVLLAFTSSKICFGNKKLLSLTKYVTLLQRQNRHFYQLFFCVLLVPQICFVDKKHCTVCKNSLLFCVRQCTTKDEVCKKTIQSCNKDVSVMQLLIPFF